MPAKTMCALVALLSCFSVIAADKKLSPEKRQALEVRRILGAYCGQCHGTGGARANKMLIDYDDLIGRKHVVPKNPEDSKLYTRIKDAEMPPSESSNPVPVGELAVIKKWIEDGAVEWPPPPPPPNDPITHQQIAKLILADLKTIPERQLKFTRYFTLTNLRNGGTRPDTMANYRTALSKLINGLSWEGEIVNPVVVDKKHKTIFRINLANYAWTPEIWDIITGQRNVDAGNNKPAAPRIFYPYNVNHKNPAFAEVRKLTTSEVPYIRADWFIANAIEPDLYHAILTLPKTDLLLEERLNVKVQQNIENFPGFRVVRSGFLKGGVANFNRIVERHKSPHGAYWKSYDFASDKNEHDIFRFPLGPAAFKDRRGQPLFDPSFEHAGGEIIFNLPNGLQAYFLTNKDGERINEAPLKLVENDVRGDRQIRNGISCMTCHTEGMRPFEKRAGELHLSIQGNIEAKIEAKEKPNDNDKLARDLYPRPDVINKLVAQDTERFKEAVKKTGGVTGGREPIALLTAHFRQSVDVTLAAGELGITVKTFRQKIKQVQRLRALGLGKFMRTETFVAREAWEENFSEIYKLATGEPDKPGKNIVEFPVRLDAGLVSFRNGIDRGALSISNLSWSPDGKILASNGHETIRDQAAKNFKSDSQLILWDAQTWDPEPKKRISIEEKIIGMDMEFFDPNDSNRIAFGIKGDPGLGEFPVGYGILNLQRPKDRPRIIHKLSQWSRAESPKFIWSKDGKKIAFFHANKKLGNIQTTVSIINEANGKIQHTLDPLKALAPGFLNRPRGFNGFGNAADWSPDGKYLATFGYDVLVVFDEQLEKEQLRFVHAHGIGAIGWDPTGKEIAFRDGRQKLNFIDVTGLGNLKRDQKIRYKPDRGPIELPEDTREILWGPQGRRIAVAFKKREKIRYQGRHLEDMDVPAINIYSKAGALLHEFVVKDVNPNPIAIHRNFFVAKLEWSPDGTMIAAGLSEGTIRVFKTPK